MSVRSVDAVRRVVAVAVAAIIISSATATVSASDPTIDARTAVVDSEPIAVSDLPQAKAALDARERANQEVIGDRPMQRRDAAIGGPGAIVPAQAAQAVTDDFSSMTYYAGGGGAMPMDLNGGVLGSTMLLADRSRLWASSTSTFQNTQNWTSHLFFKLPAGEFYFGTFVVASIYRGRWVAVMPSFQGPAAACARGFLNVAVSTSSNPGKPWNLFRIPIADAFTDIARIGVSDDKVVISVNEFDLDPSQPDCIGGAFEGSRIRVVDWADLVDAGAVVVRDVSPTPRTDYWSWMPATHVPGTGSTSTGTTVRLAASRFVGEWGHLAYAHVTGSAKAGTAKLLGNVDLYAAQSIGLLTGPPPTIAAFPSGNGSQDEKIVSAVARGNRMWLGTNGTCRLDPDMTFRACARFIILDTSVSPPTKVSDGFFVDIEVDTFNAQVGVARDGTTYYSMARSSALAHEPIGQFMTYRPANATLAGPDEALVTQGEATYEAEALAFAGSFVPDPLDMRQAWAIYPVSTWDATSNMSLVTRIKGGLTGDPGGTFYLNSGNGWSFGYYGNLTFRPDGSSPIRRVRFSASPDVDITPQGPRLIHAREYQSLPYVFAGDLNAPDLGGQPDGQTVTLWTQWQTGDGTWSTPTSYTATIDDLAPVVSPLSLSFALGTVGTTTPVKVAWSILEEESGVGEIYLSQSRTRPTSEYLTLTYGPTIRSTIRSLRLGYRYDMMLQAIDKAGNGGQTPHVILTPTISSGTSIGTWSTQSGSSFLGGSTRYSTRAGSRMSLTITGRAVAFVTTKASNRGKAEIWVDGVKKATLDLRSSSTRYRQVVWRMSWATAGTHTVQVRVLGTSGRPRVDVDAFLRF